MLGSAFNVSLEQCSAMGEYLLVYNWLVVVEIHSLSNKLVLSIVLTFLLDDLMNEHECNDTRVQRWLGMKWRGRKRMKNESVLEERCS
jgi:hypothetical protein